MCDRAPFPLRPHHALCFQNFAGEGYNDDFTRSLTRIRELLVRDPDRKVCLTSECDRVCDTCPNRRGKVCSSPKPLLFDQNVLSMTGLFPGQVLAWKELLALTEPLNRGRLEECCPGCQWLSLCLSLQGKAPA